VAGLVGGGPVFLGAMVGYNVSSEPLELLFYSVSAGAILYVIGEVWTAMRRLGHRELGLLMLSAGVTLGAMTELVIAYGGG
jgi:ZIP family zinc transporter